MSLIMAIVVVVVIYRFWSVLRVAENSAKQAANSGLNALVKGAARLEAVTPNLTEAEFKAIRDGRRQLLMLEDIAHLSDEELRQLFEADTKVKANTKTKK